MAKTLNPSSNPSIQTSVQVPENGVDAMDAGQVELIAQRMLDNDKVAKDHIDSTSPHQATSGANANRLVLRDGAGRAQVASPTAAADIATKGYVDGKITIYNFSLNLGGSSIQGGAAGEVTITVPALPSTARVLLVPNGYNDGGGALTPPFFFLIFGVYKISSTQVKITYFNPTNFTYSITNPYSCSLVILG